MPQRHPVPYTGIWQLEASDTLAPPPVATPCPPAPRGPPPPPPAPPKPDWIQCNCARPSAWAYGQPRMCTIPEEEDRSKRSERDRRQQPVAERDMRTMVVELRRRCRHYTFSDEQMAALLPARPDSASMPLHLTPEYVSSLRDDQVESVFQALTETDLRVRETLANFFPKFQNRMIEIRAATDCINVLRECLRHVAEDLHCRNGKLVQYNLAFTALTGSNTAPYFLGTVEQSRAAMFYIVKYVTKDKTPLAACLPVLMDAKRHIDKYPSVAENTGDTIRTAQHFLTRTLNSCSGNLEIGSCQGSSISLGHAGTFSSHKFTHMFPWDVLRWVLAHKQTERSSSGEEGPSCDVRLPTHAREEGASEDDSDKDQSESEEDTTCQQGVCARCLLSICRRPASGSVAASANYIREQGCIYIVLVCIGNCRYNACRLCSI